MLMTPDCLEHFFRGLLAQEGHIKQMPALVQGPGRVQVILGAFNPLENDVLCLAHETKNSIGG